MLARLLVVAACAAAIALLGSRLADRRACDQARRALFGLAVRGTPPPDGLAATTRTVADRCADADDVAAAAASLVVAGRAHAGGTLARAAVDRAPEQFAGWVALEAALRRSDPAGAPPAGGPAPGGQTPVVGTGGAAAGAPG